MNNLWAHTLNAPEVSTQSDIRMGHRDYFDELVLIANIMTRLMIVLVLWSLLLVWSLEEVKKCLVTFETPFVSLRGILRACTLGKYLTKWRHIFGRHEVSDPRNKFTYLIAIEASQTPNIRSTLGWSSLKLAGTSVLSHPPADYSTEYTPEYCNSYMKAWLFPVTLTGIYSVRTYYDTCQASEDWKHI